MPATEPRRAVFLDRDGVLIENCEHYARSWSDVEIFLQAVEGCRILDEAGYALIVVTNQAIVGRGILPLPYITALNDRIIDALRAAGAPILDAYLCPHHPDDDCDCRKPKPGMLLQAAKEHNLDPSRSYLVGDNITDIQAGSAAGTHPMLVRTGRGAENEPRVAATFGDACPVFDNLLGAALYISGAARE